MRGDGILPVMEVGNGGNNGGFGNNGDWAWIIVLFLIFGWGRNGFGNGFGGGSGIPDNFALPARFGKRLEASKEKVMSCDFIYENNGMLVGFNKEQIMDAVRGRKKCLITTSSSTIDFIRQIKAAYGEYVTVIGTYIDDRTLKILFESLPGVTDEELRRRIATGIQIKKSILADRKLFDYIVMYGGDNSVFNIASILT